MSEDRVRWDRRFREEPRLARLAPTPILVAHADLLPARGRALDIACGAGRNALFLASRRFDTTGVDISSAGLALARATAAERGLSVELVEADLASPGFTLEPASWDVITVVHYLERRLFPTIESALRPGGILFFETFTRDQLVFPEAHPRREEFLLERNELVRAFPRLQVIHYEEKLWRLAGGERAVVATLFARAPAEGSPAWTEFGQGRA
jgi:SAM-dependent methyltransferase